MCLPALQCMSSRLSPYPHLTVCVFSMPHTNFTECALRLISLPGASGSVGHVNDVHVIQLFSSVCFAIAGISIVVILVIVGALVGGYVYVQCSMRRNRPLPRWPTQNPPLLCWPIRKPRLPCWPMPVPGPPDPFPPLPWPQRELGMGDRVHFCIHNDSGMAEPGGSGMGTIVNVSPGAFQEFSSTMYTLHSHWTGYALAFAMQADIAVREFCVACACMTQSRDAR